MLTSSEPLLTEDFFRHYKLHYITYFVLRDLIKAYGKTTLNDIALHINLFIKKYPHYAKYIEGVDITTFLNTALQSNFTEGNIRQTIADIYEQVSTEKVIEKIASSRIENVSSYAKTLLGDISSMKQLYLNPLSSISHVMDIQSTVQSATTNLYTKDDMIPTGWDLIDETLGGGLNKYGDLMIYLAPPNRGKTAYLLHHTVNCMQQGYKCLFISGETSIPILYKRLCAMLLGVPMKDLHLYKKELEIKLEYIKKIGGDIFFTQFIDKLAYTPEMMEKEIADYMSWYKVDIVFVDYFDKMQPNFSFKTTELRLKLAHITQEGRNMSFRLHVPIVTVSQTNRFGSLVPLITEENMGEDFTKVAIADRIISVNSTYKEFKDKEMRLFFIKNRDGAKNVMIQFLSDFASMTFQDMKYLDLVSFLNEQEENKKLMHKAKKGTEQGK